MSAGYFGEFCGLGFSQINLREKEINSLTRTAFYNGEMMSRQAWRQEYEFEKECINQMARSTLREHNATFPGDGNMKQTYAVAIRIGFGITYTKYNTLMHFLNVAEAYWHNPDLNAIQIFGKDIRALLTTACGQKVFFEAGHSYYHYGPIELNSSGFGRGGGMDLQVASASGEAPPSVSAEKRGNRHTLVVTDRVYEHGHLRGILLALCDGARGARIKTDDVVINLTLLSLLLDFGLCDEYAHLLNLPFLRSLAARAAGRAGGRRRGRRGRARAARQSAAAGGGLQLDPRVRQGEHVRLGHAAQGGGAHLRVRPQVLCQQELLDALEGVRAAAAAQRRPALPAVRPPVQGLRLALPDHALGGGRLLQALLQRRLPHRHPRQLLQGHLRLPRRGDAALLVHRAPRLRQLRRAAPLRDARSQPEIHLYKVRFDSATAHQSAVKYIEFANAFKAHDDDEHFLIFIADNALLVEGTPRPAAAAAAAAAASPPARRSASAGSSSRSRRSSSTRRSPSCRASSTPTPRT